MEFTRSGRYGTLRFKSTIRNPEIAAIRATQELAADLEQAVQGAVTQVTREIQMYYPDLTDWDVTRRVTKYTVSVGLVMRDTRFPFREYDTEPHWPPFGKCTALYAWAQMRGISPFLLAWSMAPREPSGAFALYCEPARGKVGTVMNMRGKGGNPSRRNPGRLVATQGGYRVTDAVEYAGRGLDVDLDLILDRIVELFNAEL
jgi:hypothetical protein